ncbi:hypothetical protein CEXT_468421 [Caerostris extrusa]|uniref:Uncharacterized protein n=1 Tax=Caerostris extrusa TaxID=172846 RepID=A0AAV4W2W1_CAEEX|nr:hypothetical protein CEXT_468421 [Caerostris extrusa]
MSHRGSSLRLSLRQVDFEFVFKDNSISRSECPTAVFEVDDMKMRTPTGHLWRCFVQNCGDATSLILFPELYLSSRHNDM